MTVSFFRYRAVKLLMIGLLCGTCLVLVGQEYSHARELVAKVQGDLQRAADFTRNNEKESERYHNVQRRLSDFDRDLARGKFEKDRLDQAIDHLKNVVKNNTLESQDRDILAADLAELGTLRDIH